MLSTEREQQLLEQLATQPNAFREVYREYFPRVYGYIAARVNSPHDAEDLVSETFLTVVEKLSTFDYRGKGSFAAWVFQIAYYKVGDYYRRKQPIDIQLDTIPHGHPSLDDHLQHQETASEIRQHIRQLPQRRQEVITLRYFGGLRNNEIAQLLGLDERTVASHLSRALNDLHQALEEAVHE